VNREEQRGDIAVADDDLGVAADGVEVEVRQQAAAAPAAADRQHRADRRVPEEGVDIGCAILVLAGQVSVTIEQVRPDLHLEAERLERLLRNLQFGRLKRRVRRRDQADGVAGREPSRFQNPHGILESAASGEGRGRGERGGRRGSEKLPAMHAAIVGYAGATNGVIVSLRTIHG